MNLKNILKIYKKANDNKQTIHPASAKIIIGKNEVNLDIPGIPSVIEITYSGICNIGSLFPITFKVHLLKNKIIIINPFRKPIPLKILEYNGKIVINDCEILTFAGNRFKADIDNLGLQELVQGQRTNVEDDTLIIHEEYEDEIKIPFSRGARASNLIDAITTVKKKISGMSEDEVLDLKETVVRTLVDKSKPVKHQEARPAPSVVSQDVPRHSIADKLREASFAEGEKAPKDKGGY